MALDLTWAYLWANSLSTAPPKQPVCLPKREFATAGSLADSSEIIGSYFEALHSIVLIVVQFVFLRPEYSYSTGLHMQSNPGAKWFPSRGNKKHSSRK